MFGSCSGIGAFRSMGNGEMKGNEERAKGQAKKITSAKPPHYGCHLFLPQRVYAQYTLKDEAYLEQEQIDDVISAFWVVEKDEKRPVDEPGSLLEGLQGVSHSA